MGYVQGWYGGGSWVLLAFLALALFRIFAARSRRGTPPGRPGPGRPWASGPGSASHFATPSTQEAKQAVPEASGQGIAAGWFADPSGRYEQRYWSGTEWTDHVTKGGVPSIDPPPGRREASPGGKEPDQPQSGGAPGEATPDPGSNAQDGAG